MNLRYNANVLCAVEHAVRKPLVEVLAELESDGGTSLSTLRALVAAGQYGATFPNFPATMLDEYQAGHLIDKHGTAACAEAVGKALKSYFSKVTP